MSLNCLTCSQALQRTDSFEELFGEKEIKEICKQVDRTAWLEKMPSSRTTTTTTTTTATRPQRDLPKGGALAKLKADHRRTQSAGDVPYSGSNEPKLIRSSGMRRNWSFEDVSAENKVSCR